MLSTEHCILQQKNKCFLRSSGTFTKIGTIKGYKAHLKFAGTEIIKVSSHTTVELI